MKGVAVNYSWADSISYAAVPTGANNNITFLLRNLTNGAEYQFEDFDIAFNRAQIDEVWKTIQGTWNAFQGKLASPGMVEIFSFDIRKLDNWPVHNFKTKNGMPEETRIHLTPGEYEFGWTSAPGYWQTGMLLTKFEIQE